ncbi:hypothetical protein [Roseivirga misakiensis]|uniref:Uncharacterized protein n=1 Tax=Roseivirga misakiensis TaxID=1563681 RepID=A0A1E5T496_9BACT|nr:hypothetical protein [Roseivirga misakiensis]OEK06200.1 hypothetical protein BFP71_00540 [Roseivirga misakiensis]
MEEKHLTVQAQPAYKLAIPLFLLTSIPYFITLAYEFVVSDKPDKTFAWFGAFYLSLGAIYLVIKLMLRKKNSEL